MEKRHCKGCGNDFYCSGKCGLEDLKETSCFCPDCFRKSVFYDSENSWRGVKRIMFKDCLVSDNEAGTAFETNFAFKLKPFENKTVGEDLRVPSSMVLRELHAVKMDGCTIGVYSDNRLFAEFKVPLGDDDYKVGIDGFGAVKRVELRVQNNYPTPRRGEIRVVGYCGEEEISPKTEATRVEGTPKISLKEIEGLEKELLGDA